MAKRIHTLGRVLPALLALAPGVARAHTYAASAFEAFTEGAAVRFDFRLDATSVMELSHRSHPDRPPIGR